MSLWDEWAPVIGGMVLAFAMGTCIEKAVSTDDRVDRTSLVGFHQHAATGTLGGYDDVYCERRDARVHAARINDNVVRVWCGDRPNQWGDPPDGGL